MTTRSTRHGACRVIAAAALAACAGPRPAVHIGEPAEGATLSGPAVHVVLEVRGVELAPAADQRPGTAHHHLFLDVDPSPAGEAIPMGVPGFIHLGKAQTEFTIDSVPPGRHRIIAVLADPSHLPLPDAVRDTVFVTVDVAP